MHGPPLHLATSAQDVFDVSGAGDTVVAVLAMGMAAGLPLSDGMRLANHAAGIVVSKLGTATVTREELVTTLLEGPADEDIEDAGSIGWDALIARRSRWGREKLSVGFTNGCFDLLHPGHVSLIAQAARACDRLVVGLNTDASVRRLKGLERPIQSEAARARVMAAIKGVAAVVLFDEDTPHALIQALRPDVLVKGSDYARSDVVGADLVEARGGRVLLAELAPGHSTTALIASSRSTGGD
jgi:D-beta-D-heptose 7-phosphate kinase/D-beta-D-heptose 1-phosphate adenosyltransferase